MTVAPCALSRKKDSIQDYLRWPWASPWMSGQVYLSCEMYLHLMTAVRRTDPTDVRISEILRRPTLPSGGPLTGMGSVQNRALDRTRLR